MSTTTTTPPRPPASLTFQNVAKELAADLSKWGMFKNWCPHKSVEDVQHDLEKAFKAERDRNGYQLAKYLDEHEYWRPDATVVEQLDNAESMIDDQLKVLHTAWVREHNIKPRHTVGSTVQVNLRRSKTTGVVKRITEEGTSLVQVEGMEGCYIVKWEDISDVEVISK